MKTQASPFSAGVAAIDHEIRAILLSRDESLRPFYGMMLYHLGLEESGVPSGKRLRPLLLTLAFEALGGDPARALPAAAAIELLHNFTLIHDDIEDHDPTRHHRPTLWTLWDVPQAINAGDGMYATSRLAVQRLRGAGFPPERVLDFAQLLDTACVSVCEGQFLDISFEARTDVTVSAYRTMVARKTGALIAAAAEGAAILATDDAGVRRTLARFGADYGQAFQAHDDLQGIWGTSGSTGKLELNDLTKRKKTLPVVLAFAGASIRVRDELTELFGAPAPLPQRSVERILAILEALEIRRALESEIAERREQALSDLRSLSGSGHPVELLERLVRMTTGQAEGGSA